MPPETLARYLLGDLDPAGRAAVDAALDRDPAAAAALERLRGVLAALELPADDVEPPPGLADRTVRAALAARPVPARRRRLGAVSDPVFAALRRADLLVAASVGFVAAGLLLGGVSRLRAERDALACRDRMRGLHAALAGYADVRSGRLPWVGTAAVPTAAAVGEELARGGQLAHAGLAACPVAEEPAPFAYTLGYRAGGRFVGPELRPALFGDAALAADPPPLLHAGGANVLFLGGSVRPTATGRAGFAGDDIYHNDAGLVQAGLHARDAALGAGDAVP